MSRAIRRTADGAGRPARARRLTACFTTAAVVAVLGRAWGRSGGDSGTLGEQGLDRLWRLDANQNYRHHSPAGDGDPKPGLRQGRPKVQRPPSGPWRSRPLLLALEQWQPDIRGVPVPGRPAIRPPKARAVIGGVGTMRRAGLRWAWSAECHRIVYGDDDGHLTECPEPGAALGTTPPFEEWLKQTGRPAPHRLVQRRCP